MDLRNNHYVSRGAGYVDFASVRMTSPTCEDLGIPTDMGDEAGSVYPLLSRRVIHNPSLHLDGLRYEAETHKMADPYSPICMIPLPGALAFHAAAEPSFIRKRNERERERVRCVNEGYERLKEHLPSSTKEKRISKVETLRGAIDYIRQLQQMLDDSSPVTKDDAGEDEEDERKTRVKAPTTANGTTKSCNSQNEGERTKRRRGSLSSEQSLLSDGTLSESEDEQFVKKRRIH